jgi:hypothetical protein
LITASRSTVDLSAGFAAPDGAFAATTGFAVPDEAFAGPAGFLAAAFGAAFAGLLAAVADRSDPSFAACRADDPDFAGAAVCLLRAVDLDAIGPL